MENFFALEHEEDLESLSLTKKQFLNILEEEDRLKEEEQNPQNKAF